MSWDLPSPFIHRRVAHHAEIDGYGHVNNAIYVAWLDDCAWAHSIERGIACGLEQRLCIGTIRLVAVAVARHVNRVE